MAYWSRSGRGGGWDGGSSMWAPYVPVAQRRANAAKHAAKMVKKGEKVEPVVIDGRKIVKTFWGTAWCENLEAYSDFSNRLPRGRTYVRNGSVIHLKVSGGKLDALVSGSSIYTIQITISPLQKKRWAQVKSSCSGKIDSLVELLQGKFSQGVMEVMTSQTTGLFPAPSEIKMACSCPDGAYMCKHLAAVLYGVGARLDTQPELLFVLREVDHFELVSEIAKTPLLGGSAGGRAAQMADADELSKVFGIEIDAGVSTPPAPRRRSKARKAPPASTKTKKPASKVKKKPRKPVKARVR